MIAGLERLPLRRFEDEIRKGQSVVAVLTGHVLKDPQAVMDFHRGRSRLANPPVEIEASVKAVARFVRKG